jgi:hypothetical protein
MHFIDGDVVSVVEAQLWEPRGQSAPGAVEIPNRAWDRLTFHS